MTLKEYEAFHAELEKRRTALDQADGAVQTLLHTLQKEHGVSGMVEGQKKLDALHALQDKLERKIGAAVEAFAKKWKRKDD